MMKILVTDGMERNAINNLVKEGFEVEEKFYEEEGLKEKIKDVEVDHQGWCRTRQYRCCLCRG